MFSSLLESANNEMMMIRRPTATTMTNVAVHFFKHFLVTHLEKKFPAFIEFGGLDLLPRPQRPAIIIYLIPSQFTPVYTLPPYSLCTVIFD
jgi:hypothetical protein